MGADESYCWGRVEIGKLDCQGGSKKAGEKSETNMTKKNTLVPIIAEAKGEDAIDA